MKKQLLAFMICGLFVFSLRADDVQSVDEQYSIENEQMNDEVDQQENTDGARYTFCRYCGKVCVDYAAKRAHEAICLQNPHHK